MYIQIATFFCLLVSCHGNCTMIEAITTLTKNFNLKNPSIKIGSNLQNNNRQILKAFSLEDKYIKFINEKHEGTSLHDSNFNLFKFVDNLQNQLPSSYENYNFVKRFETVIIISKNVENILASIPLDININQKMFFLDKDTFNLFEAYTINSRKVMQNIGHIRSKDFVWRNGIEPHFEYRRSNFKDTAFSIRG